VKFQFMFAVVGSGRTSGGANVTTIPLAYVQVDASALNVPISVSGGRQAVAISAVLFQQFASLASQPQVRVSGAEDPQPGAANAVQPAITATVRERRMVPGYA